MLIIPYANVSSQSLDSMLLSLLAFNAILLTSSVNRLWASLLKLCCNFSINRLLSKNYLWFFFQLIYSNIIFFTYSILFSLMFASWHILVLKFNVLLYYKHFSAFYFFIVTKITCQVVLQFWSSRKVLQFNIYSIWNIYSTNKKLPIQENENKLERSLSVDYLSSIKSLKNCQILFHITPKDIRSIAPHSLTFAMSFIVAALFLWYTNFWQWR